MFPFFESSVPEKELSFYCPEKDRFWVGHISDSFSKDIPFGSFGGPGRTENITDDSIIDFWFRFHFHFHCQG